MYVVISNAIFYIRIYNPIFITYLICKKIIYLRSIIKYNFRIKFSVLKRNIYNNFATYCIL